MNEVIAVCYSCGKDISLGVKSIVMRGDECPSCTADLHVCKMCQHFDLGSYNECREPNAERVVDKEKANFCEHFVVNLKADSANKKRENFLSSADALFKK